MSSIKTMRKKDMFYRQKLSVTTTTFPKSQSPSKNKINISNQSHIYEFKYLILV